MGDRISISFIHSEYGESVALFSHWRGVELVREATAYVKKLKKSIDRKGGMPIDRLQSGTVMVDFIRHLTSKMKRVVGDLYLGIDETDGDNSNNGHYRIRLD